MCVMCVGVCVPQCMWRAEDNFMESALSFYFYLHSRDPTQVCEVSTFTLCGIYLTFYFSYLKAIFLQNFLVLNRDLELRGRVLA